MFVLDFGFNVYICFFIKKKIFGIIIFGVFCKLCLFKLKKMI